MRVMMFMVIALCGTVSVAGAQTSRLLVTPHVAAGSATRGFTAPQFGFGAAVEIERSQWSPRLEYQRFSIYPACKLSAPPLCDVDGGDVFVAGLARSLTTSTPLTPIVRLDVGVARWRNNAETGGFTKLIGGLAGELRIAAGAGVVSVGAYVRVSSTATLAGGSLGLGIGL